MKYNIDWVKKQYNSGNKLLFIPFFGHTNTNGKIGKQCFSQWFSCKFTVGGILYHTAEQYMMAQKALLFKDESAYKKIMSADNPSDYKAIGRTIHNFDAKIWDEHKFDIVVKGNVAKFEQNPELLKYLLSTGNQILVEASPYDDIWGVKLKITDNDIHNPNLWRGQNLLGFAIMEARDILKEKYFNFIF